MNDETKKVLGALAKMPTDQAERVLGAMLEGDPSKERTAEGGRRSGRTLAMVRALPETGSVVVVHTPPLRDYVKQMIRDIRGADVARRTNVVVCRQRIDAYEFLTGHRIPVIFDHAYRGSVPDHVEQLARSTAAGCNAAIDPELKAIVDSIEQSQ